MARTRLFTAVKDSLKKATALIKSGMSLDDYRETEARLRLSRREFLKASAVLGAAVTLTRCSGSSGGTGLAGNNGPRVGIIGGGMAGLHAAYRLGQAGFSPRVFEAADRVGGRMWSIRNRYPDGQVAELGGELIDSGHATMLALAEEFGIELDDLVVDTAGLRQDTWLINGRLLTEDELLAEMTPVSAAIDRALTAAEEDDAVFEVLDNMSIIDWLDSIGASKTARDLLDVAYTAEYGREASEQSLFNLFYLIDFREISPFRVYGESDERFHSHRGSSAFTEALAGPLEAVLSLETKVEAVSERTGGGYTVSYSKGLSAKEFDCDYVVSAVPFTLLREMELNIPLSEDKKRVIAELGYGTNAKVMLGYRERPWRSEHQASGSAQANNGLQTIWETSRGQSGSSAILTNFVGGTRGIEIGQGTAEDQARTIRPLVESVFPGTDTSYREGSATRMHWPSYPYTKGSYACYLVGQWSFFTLEGAQEGNVHFCGEHTSQDFQGYMEGAAESGMRVASEIAGAGAKRATRSRTAAGYLHHRYRKRARA